MRSFDAYRAPAPHQAVKLLHGAHHIVQVLDYMDRRQAVERAVGKRVRVPVEVREDVGAAGGIAIDSDGTGLLVNPAADVEYPHPFSMAASEAACARHSSSVVAANSHWSRVTTRGGHSRMVESPAPSTRRPRWNARASTRSRSAGAGSRVCRSRTSSTPIIKPSPRTSPTTGKRAGHWRSRSMR